jgi:membrane-bound lytic murein transglycosylase D
MNVLRRPGGRLILALALLAGASVQAGDDAKKKPEKADWYDLGKALFDQYATDEIKAEYTFPTREDWEDFLKRFQDSLENGSLEELAAYEEEARAALELLKTIPEQDETVAWLSTRLDEVEAARVAAATRAPPTRPQEAPPKPLPPGLSAEVPHYDLWVGRVQKRPLPPSAVEYGPLLRRVFEREGLPPELVWLAEAESTFNPKATSPAGARGLFQLMPQTAKAQGLSLFPLDERTEPEKSAAAAARLLRTLHDRFGSWPLALAAYNAGEGRVSRTLKARKGRSYADIAEALPGETRMYVPKVLAMVAVREGMDPARLPPPREP